MPLQAHKTALKYTASAGKNLSDKATWLWSTNTLISDFHCLPHPKWTGRLPETEGCQKDT